MSNCHQTTNRSWILEVRFGDAFFSARERDYLPTFKSETLPRALSANRSVHIATPYFRLCVGETLLFFAGAGRLDNRIELIQRLGLPKTALLPEVICHAYLLFGADFERHLLGDFSFALVDEKRQHIKLVRDPLGIRPLYYHRTGQLCIASNSLDSMLECPSLCNQIDSTVVAEWCVNGNVFNQERTFFNLIRKCPSATAVQIDSQRIDSKKYWNIDSIEPLKYSDERDYVLHLRELITTAVHDRNDATATVGSHSSGGLDSTPIAICAGREIIAAGSTFHTFNWCKPETPDDAPSSEWEIARRVADSEQFQHHEIGITAQDIKHSLIQHDIARDGTTSFEYERSLLSLASRRGVALIYSGFGGDEFLTAAIRDKHYSEIRAGKFGYVLNRLKLEENPSESSRYLRRLGASLRLFFESLLPTRLLLRDVVAFDESKFRAMHELLRNPFASIAGLHRNNIDDFLTHTVRRRQYAMLHCGYHQERIECWDILGRRAGVEYVYPYLDRRIVEFAIAIPPDLYYRHGKSRYLYRKSLGEMLPEYLRDNRKLQEKRRVLQLLRESLKALADPEVLELVANAESPYVNTGLLLAKCRERVSLNSSDLRHCILHVKSVINAILTLNINKGNGTLC